VAEMRVAGGKTVILMPNCQNCGSHVSEDYARVFREGDEPLRCCPDCPDRTRGAGGPWKEKA
jgi:hypothetical protein